MNDNFFELKDIKKIYPGVIALNDVEFSLKKGEVHALVGENGAGKSTLVKIITGVIKPTYGKIYYHGEEISWSKANDSINAGIAAIYQEPAIFPDLNVAENIFLGHQPKFRFSRNIKWKELYKKTQELFEHLNCSIKPTDKIISLSNAERQLVEIAKALSINAKIVIMDEPTSALSLSESEQLFKIVKQLKDNNVSVIFISHRIEDIFRVADRVTALRDGCVVGTREIDSVDKNELIKMMVGREVDNLFPKKESVIGEELLRVENLSKYGKYKDVSLNVKSGEILGIYGLIGAGRTEVAKTIFGLDQPDSGKIILRGEVVSIKRPEDAIKNGIAYITEDRDEEGIILDMSIIQNISLPILQKLKKGIFIDKDQEKEVTEKFTKKLELKAATLFDKVMSLSGGNKQKVVLAKWLASGSDIIILDEPTKGIDVGAKAAVHKLISELASTGYGVIMISSDLPEITGMSDRIIVMHEGIKKAEFNRSNVTDQEILDHALSENKSGEIN